MINGQLLFSGTLCQGLVITQDFTLSDTADLTGVFTSDDVILSTTALSFRAVVGGPAPAAQTLDISATGSSAVSYTAAFEARNPSGWNVALSPSQGIAPASTTISPQTAGLAPGRYTGMIGLNLTQDGAPSTRLVAVTLDVYAAADAAKVPIAGSPSMALSYLVDAVTYETTAFTITNNRPDTRSFSLGNITNPLGLLIAVSPPSFSLKAGESQKVSFSSRKVSSPASAPAIATFLPRLPTVGGDDKACVEVCDQDGNCFTYCTLPADELCLDLQPEQDTPIACTVGEQIPVGNPNFSASSCQPQYLLPVFTRIDPVAVSGTALNGRLQVLDSCGSPVSGYSATIQFGNLTPGGTRVVKSFSPVGQSSRAVTTKGVSGVIVANAAPDMAFTLQPSEAIDASSVTKTLLVQVTAPSPIGGAPLAGATQKDVPVRFEPATAYLSNGGVVSAASFEPHPVSPGEIISVFGKFPGLSPQVFGLPYPLFPGGTWVEFDGQPLPLIYAGPSLIDTFIPFYTVPGTHSMTVFTSTQVVDEHCFRVCNSGSTTATCLRQCGGSSTVGSPDTRTLSGPFEIGVVAANPAFFTVDGTGSGQGHVYNIVGPNQILADQNHPAQSGDILTMYVAGLGDPQAPGIPTGDAAPLTSLPAVLPTTVTIGDSPAVVLYAGLAPGWAGLYQINAQISRIVNTPAAAGAGPVSLPITISTGGYLSSQNFTAWFVPDGTTGGTVQVSFVTSPVPLSIAINGKTFVGNTGLLSLNAGQTIPIDVPVDPQTLSDPGTRYRFYGWSQGGNKSQNLVAPSVNTAYAAYFLTERKLTIAGAATAKPASADSFYSEDVYGVGQAVAVTGSCPSGQTLSGYQVGITGQLASFASGPTVTVTMDAPRTVTVMCSIVKLTSCVSPPAGMIAWYPLDETQSPSLDIATGGAKSFATWVGSPGSIAGMVGKALSFGANQYVEAAGAAEGDIGTGDFSVDAWVQASPSTGVTTFIDKRDLATGVRGYAFYLFNGNLGFQLADNSTNSAICSSNPASSGCTNWGTSALVADGKWHLVAVTVSRGSNTGGKLFVDGAQVLTFDPTIRSLSLSNSARLRIGGGFGSDFLGNVDEVEIFGRALLPSEVQLLYTAGSLGKCKPSLQTVTLTVQTNPVGLQARIGASGSFAPAPISQLVQANQTQTVSVTDPQFNTATGIGYSFTGWSTGGSTANTNVQPSSNFTATANFKVACYALTVNVQPPNSGSVALSPASGGLTGLPANCYAPGTVVALTATAATGNVFQIWTGATGTANTTTTTVTITAPVTVTANFAVLPSVTLTVATNPTGLQARIGTSGAYAAAPISQQVPANQTQTISVTDPQFVSGTGYSFTGWSTGGSTATTTVQPASNFTAAANFKIACYALTVNVQPANSGSVALSPASGGLTGLPPNCYAPGTVVTLTAAGASGNVLQSWTGAPGTGNTTTVTVNAASTVTANFAPPPVVTVFLQSRPSGSANLSMGVTNSGVTTATNVTVTAITGITATGATFVYNPGLLVIPFVIPGAAALNPGATSGFNLNFTATSGSAAAPFSFVITVKADNVPAFSTTINVP